jgi:hypothetical protein
MDNCSSSLKNELENNKDNDKLWYLLWKECFYKYKNRNNHPFDIWKNIIRNI